MTGIAIRPTRRGSQPAVASLRTIVALMLREMASSHGRAPGGYIWVVVEPVGGIGVLSVAFSLFLHRPALGANFPLFYASAYLPFTLYAVLSGKIGQALAFSRPLLSFPAVTFADAILARFALNLLTQLVVFALVIGGIHLIWGLRFTPDWGAILMSLAMAAALGLGVGTFNCYLRGVFAFWDTVWGVLNRPLFIASGLFFLFESVPGDARDALWWNPLIHVTGEMRRGLYPGYEAAYVSPAYVFGCALIPLALGLLLLRRTHRDLLNG